MLRLNLKIDMKQKWCYKRKHVLEIKVLTFSSFIALTYAYNKLQI